MKRLLLLAAALFAFTMPASAEFKLDSRYQDADGDLVADTPTDPAQQVDPSTLIFAYTPVEDPAVYAKVWEGFLKHMEEKTGKKVQFFPVRRSGNLLIADSRYPSSFVKAPPSPPML